MRITGRQLRQIIKEEVARMMNEEDAPTQDAGPAGAVAAALKAKSDIRGVTRPQGIKNPTPWTPTPIDATLSWVKSKSDPSMMRARNLKFNTPVKGTFGELITGLNLMNSSGPGNLDIDEGGVPAGWTALNTARTYTGVPVPGAETLTDAVSVPVKVQFAVVPYEEGGMSMSTSYLAVYTITPA
jgi:hypothetical protein